MKHRTPRRIAALVAFTAASVIPVQAQETETRALDEIIITATYREEGLQDVPVSVSAVAGETIVETAIQKAEDIQFLVPNFSLTETGISTFSAVRGIGTGINQAFEQSVGTYVDGVHRGRGQQFRAPFLDLERVEVLRGPQSILFGKNSVAGALNITTAKPTDEFEGSILASHEFEYNESIVEGMVSGPLSDRARYRVAARSRQLDGHIRNAFLNTDEPEREDWTVRATLEFDVTDDLVATLKAEVGEFDVVGRHIEVINEQPSTGGPAGELFAFYGAQWNQILQVFGGDPSISNVTQDGIRTANEDFSFNDSSEFVLTLDWAIGEHELKSITSAAEFEYDESCDCDFTGAIVFGADLQETYDQFSQEFRLSSPLGGTVDYIAGLYYQTSDHDYADQISVPATSVLVPILDALQGAGTGAGAADTQASRNAAVENDVMSAFVQVNWHIDDNWTLQLGGRVTSDERDGSRTLSITNLDFGALEGAQAVAAPLIYGGLFAITSTNLVALTEFPDPEIAGTASALVYGVPNVVPGLGVLPVEGSRDNTEFSPEVKLVWDVSDDTLLYLSWSEGFKSGGFDFRANNRNFYSTMSESFEYEDEQAENIEIGGKFTVADGAAELGFSAFKMEFSDLQISIFDGVLGFNVGNAASADIKGLEGDLRWAASDYLTISGGISFIDFEFTDFENGQCYFGANSDVTLNGVALCSYTGNSNQMLSDFQGNVNFNFSAPVGDNLELSALFNLFYTDDYDASATYDPGLVQEAYTTVNARLGIGSADGSWQVALFAKNLTDEEVLTFGGDLPLSGSRFYAKSNYAFFNPGRTMSLQALFRF